MAHPNIFDFATGNLSNITYKVQANTAAGYFFAQGVDNVLTINTNTNSMYKYIDQVHAPSLKVPTALSTEIEMTEPAPDTNYVTYSYQVDGGAPMSLAQLIEAYKHVD